MKNIILGVPITSSRRKELDTHEYFQGTKKQLKVGQMNPAYKPYKKKGSLLHQNYHHKNIINNIKVRLNQ